MLKKRARIFASFPREPDVVIFGIWSSLYCFNLLLRRGIGRLPHNFSDLDRKTIVSDRAGGQGSKARLRYSKKSRSNERNALSVLRISIAKRTERERFSPEISPLSHQLSQGALSIFPLPRFIFKRVITQASNKESAC